VLLLQIQQNSFNLLSENLEMLIYQLLRRVLPKKFFTAENRQNSETYSKRPPGVPVHQPLWYLLTPCLLNQILQL
jgi:hypothetical protein